jgi:hypothetical protein
MRKHCRVFSREKKSSEIQRIGYSGERLEKNCISNSYTLKKERLKMKMHYAFLCDSANVSAHNLFNVLGGGIEKINFTQFPQIRQLVLLLRIEYAPATEGGEHKLDIRFVDADGQDKFPPVGMNLKLLKTEKFFNMVMNLTPRFEKPGAHSVDIAVDKQVIVSIPLEIAKINA